jgi:hypothetical protein
VPSNPWPGRIDPPNSLIDRNPNINDNGYVVWPGCDGADCYGGDGDFEIFLAEPRSGYSATANAEASGYGPNSLTASKTFNGLTLVLMPIGDVIFLRILLRKR